MATRPLLLATLLMTATTSTAVAQGPAGGQADATSSRRAQILTRATKLFPGPDFKRHQRELCTGLITGRSWCRLAPRGESADLRKS